jgi:hypothetical protein
MTGNFFPFGTVPLLVLSHRMNSQEADYIIESIHLGNERSAWIRRGAVATGLCSLTIFLNAELYRDRVGSGAVISVFGMRSIEIRSFRGKGGAPEGESLSIANAGFVGLGEMRIGIAQGHESALGPKPLLVAQRHEHAIISRGNEPAPHSLVAKKHRANRKFVSQFVPGETRAVLHD